MLGGRITQVIGHLRYGAVIGKERFLRSLQTVIRQISESRCLVFLLKPAFEFVFI